MKTKNRMILLYASLIDTLNTADTKTVDKSEIVPPYVFEDQDAAGEVDYDGLMAEIMHVLDLLHDKVTDLVGMYEDLSDE